MLNWTLLVMVEANFYSYWLSKLVQTSSKSNYAFCFRIQGFHLFPIQKTPRFMLLLWCSFAWCLCMYFKDNSHFILPTSMSTIWAMVESIFLSSSFYIFFIFWRKVCISYDATKVLRESWGKRFFQTLFLHHLWNIIL